MVRKGIDVYWVIKNGGIDILSLVSQVRKEERQSKTRLERILSEVDR